MSAFANWLPICWALALDERATRSLRTPFREMSPGARVPGIAGLVILILQAVFWLGFRLPYRPPLVVAAAVALVVGMVADRR